MKRFAASLLLVFVIVFPLVFLSASASDSSAASEEAPAFSAERLERAVVDTEGVLSESEKNDLAVSALTCADKYGCDVTAVIIGSLGEKTATEYADDYFDYEGYGIGESKDGILLLISVTDRKWALSTHGKAIDWFNDDDLDTMSSNFLDSLSENRYADCISSFINSCDIELEYENSNTGMIFWIIICVLVGFLLAGIPMSRMKKQILNVAPADDAANYVRDGSMNVRVSTDRFLYSRTTKTYIPKSESSGSSTHSSSSGESHGGSSGSF